MNLCAIERLKSVYTHYEALILKAEDITEGRALDVGCGIGAGLSCLTDHGYEAYGVDFSKTILLQGRKIVKSARLFLADAEKLPFRDKAFELILMKDVFEHLKNPIKAAREVYRCLIPGGIYLIDMPNIWDLTRVKCTVMGETWKGHHREHINLMNPITLKSLLKACGFKRVEVGAKGMVYIPFIGRTRLGRRLNALLGRIPIVKLFCMAILARVCK